MTANKNFNLAKSRAEIFDQWLNEAFQTRSDYTSQQKEEENRMTLPTLPENYRRILSLIKVDVSNLMPCFLDVTSKLYQDHN
ncbi:hypothetical protein ABZ559_04615 [Streptococcus sp. ZY19097]|uniref:hypothetical protein n=1 Tax=Streptococcus sp. ZY19097 TaxID=3231906 RepID=UPI003459CCF9